MKKEYSSKNLAKTLCVALRHKLQDHTRILKGFTDYKRYAR